MKAGVIDVAASPRDRHRRGPGGYLSAAPKRRRSDVTESEPVVHHPVVVAHSAHRAADIQLRVADAITAFAGSMPFVYIHAIAFVVWMLVVESDPWPKLTLVVSLEAIFLSTFVMIGQNRQAKFQQLKADHDFVEQEQELKTNTELTREVHALATAIHSRIVDDPGAG
ncbi:MAG: hypothetical protein QOG43_1222 [Actinomycetota bacterium]|jgi:uncharacterized membrane protein|nr:hypothetical protein [Actinomycetota bacterium]